MATEEQNELSIFKTVLLHCVLIIALPVIAFFTTKVVIFDGIFGVDSTKSNVYAAGLSIIVLHIALGAFIYRAYYDSPTKTQAKSD